MKKFIAMLSAAALGMLFAHVGLSQTLVVSPVEIDVTGTVLQGATAASLEVYNGAKTNTSYYTVSVPAAATNWVTSDTATGSSTGEIDAIVLTFVTTALTPGIYDTDVTITQTNAPVTVKTIPVVLRVDRDDNQGIAIGPSSAATAESGIAIGDRTGRAIAIGANTIQIGGGVNSGVGTTAIRGFQLLDADGNIVAARLAAGIQQTDTNTTTSVTTYTPRYVGDMLTGQAGAGTSTLWVSSGTTTNDWTAIGP